MSWILLAQAIPQNDDQLDGFLLFAKVLLVVVSIAGFAIIVWLARYVISCRGMSQKALSHVEEQMTYLARAREHMEAAERHMAAVEKKLDEVIDQLKRRPLS